MIAKKINYYSGLIILTAAMASAQVEAAWEWQKPPSPGQQPYGCVGKYSKLMYLP